MATPVATAFALVTGGTSSNLGFGLFSDRVFGIVYSDGKVLTVALNNLTRPQLRTLSQVRALGLTLTAVPFEDPYSDVNLYRDSQSVQPCTIVYRDGAAVAAILAYNKLIFRGASGAASDIAIRASAAFEVNKGANIHSRHGVSARPWGAATTTTVTGFGQG